MDPTVILEGVKLAVGAIFKALTAFFIYDYGKKTVETKDLTKEVTDAKDAGKLDNSIAQLSDSDLDKLL